MLEAKSFLEDRGLNPSGYFQELLRPCWMPALREIVDMRCRRAARLASAAGQTQLTTTLRVTPAQLAILCRFPEAAERIL
jgi:hypothetical protein